MNLQWIFEGSHNPPVRKAAKKALHVLNLEDNPPYCADLEEASGFLVNLFTFFSVK